MAINPAIIRFTFRSVYIYIFIYCIMQSIVNQTMIKLVFACIRKIRILRVSRFRRSVNHASSGPTHAERPTPGLFPIYLVPQVLYVNPSYVTGYIRRHKWTELPLWLRTNMSCNIVHITVTHSLSINIFLCIPHVLNK